EGMRGGAIRGLNVTIPFKEQALAVADISSSLAKAAGAANLLLFHDDGRIEARNTDGEGLLRAIAVQAPGFDILAGPATVMGAGGAARGAVAALLEAGVSEVRLCNRTLDRAEKLVEDLSGVMSGALVRAFERADHAVEGATCVINATSLGLGGGPGPDTPWRLARDGAVAMDMVYKPLDTEWLQEARTHGLRIVDGLEMLIRQAIPSYRALYGADPPDLDVRPLLLRAGAAG
ncbi:MAG: shikimate dehydrogenase family protein, partial [Caulobacteraceae bacterium]